MAIIDGTFPDARGHPQPRTRMQVDVTKTEARQYQITVDGVGKGTITMMQHSGTGQFRLLNDELLDFAATRVRDGLQFRLHRMGQEIAKGVIRDLPP